VPYDDGTAEKTKSSGVRGNDMNDMPHMSDETSVAAGVAALSICESLMLALGDLKIMEPPEAVGIISDAAEAHRGAGTTPKQKAMHAEVVAILDKIIAGGNSVRRS
jgi:hypothetical protein